ncbi:MAG: cytochrome c oxidase subunit 3 [Acidobacteriota bacterium]
MNHAPADGTSASWWAGGVNPYGISHKKLGMWLFILSDSLTFAAALFGYSYLRLASTNWPRPFQMWPSVAVSTLMTFCLLSSSLTMVLAVHHAKNGDRSRAARWLLATMAGGIAFLALHANEWRGLIQEGMGLTANPWGDPLFGGTFFTLTGLHMFHVLSGVCYLGVIAYRFSHGRLTGDDVEISGLYWHFVDLVWMFVFPMVYLLSVSAVGGH